MAHFLVSINYALEPTGLAPHTTALAQHLSERDTTSGADGLSVRAAMTEWPDVDVVIVSTVNNVLAPVTLAAVAAGKHVLVEKPAALMAFEVDDVIDPSRWFLGDFTQVDGFAQTHFWQMPVDDNAFLLLRTAEQRQPVREAVRKAGLEKVRFRFDFEGTKVLFS